MTNVKDLLISYPDLHHVLSVAGELGQEQNLEIYVVGGVVRDLLLQTPIVEADLMVVGDGIEFAKLLAVKLGVKNIVPYKQFGTAMIPNKPIIVEVASARTEEYNADSRKPTQIQYTDLKGDLLRRDFTINAMAVDICPEFYGDLHDPFHGISDLKKKQLVTPLSPDETFSEDPIRMIRAAYFIAKLNLKIDEYSFMSMKRQAHRIGIVSKERVTAELTKILKTKTPSIGLSLLQDAGLMKHVFPEIDQMYGLEQAKDWHHKDVFHHTLQVVDNVAKMSDKMELRFAALVHDIAKPRTRRLDYTKGYTFHGHDEIGARMMEKIAKRMKLSNKLKEYLMKMIRLHLRPISLAKKGVTDSAVRRVMVSAEDDIEDLLMLCRADITSKNPHLVKRYLGNFDRVEAFMLSVREQDKLRAFQSPVRGDEIMEVCGLTEGKIVGKIKTEIENAILDGEIDNTYEAAHQFMLNVKDDIIAKNS
ncbi:MAG: HD domain-containing protein [Candidatus Marinimicrobia bacterium]|nr:HD domain-containing protein [Candidatus Neomarinimicrobiota bacterium]